MIGFVIENRRVSFVINRPAADAAGLRLSFEAPGSSEGGHKVTRDKMRSGLTFRDYPISQKLMLDHHVDYGRGDAAGLHWILSFDSYLFSAKPGAESVLQLARIVADNSTASLAFGDPRTAAEPQRPTRATPYSRCMHLFRKTAPFWPAIFAAARGSHARRRIGTTNCALPGTTQWFRTGSSFRVNATAR